MVSLLDLTRAVAEANAAETGPVVVQIFERQVDPVTHRVVHMVHRPDLEAEDTEASNEC